MKTSLRVFAGLMVFTALPLVAGVQGEVDEKYKIPVPIEQRKVSVDETKSFQEGALTLTLQTVERSGVGILAGSTEVNLPASTETLIEGADGNICNVVYLGMTGKRAIISAACEPGSEELRAAMVAQQSAAPVEIVDPVDLIAGAEKGSLTNPYLGDSDAIAQGHSLFLANSCNGCHGGTGGGGMGPPLSNGVWVYGKDDDTLFRLVTAGSDEMLALGYSRIAREKVVGPMPPYEGIIENADDLWKILAWVRSVSPSDAPPAKQ